MRKPKPKLTAAQSRQLAAGGSATHVGLWIQSPAGNIAHIHADPKMAKETMDALGEMIDQAVKAHAKGELKPKCG